MYFLLTHHLLCPHATRAPARGTLQPALSATACIAVGCSWHAGLLAYPFIWTMSLLCSITRGGWLLPGARSGVSSCSSRRRGWATSRNTSGKDAVPLCVLVVTGAWLACGQLLGQKFAAASLGRPVALLHRVEPHCAACTCVLHPTTRGCTPVQYANAHRLHCCAVPAGYPTTLGCQLTSCHPWHWVLVHLGHTWVTLSLMSAGQPGACMLQAV